MNAFYKMMERQLKYLFDIECIDCKKPLKTCRKELVNQNETMRIKSAEKGAGICGKCFKKGLK